MNRLVIATGNRDKFEEMREFLSGLPLAVEGLEAWPDAHMPPETGDTFGENATIKAVHVARATGLPSLADDSGLEVDALDGRPGVLSARYAGEEASPRECNEKLLGEMAGVQDGGRGATFVCVLALAVPGPGGEICVRMFEGRCRGRIAREPAGSGGFGYDPLFFYPPAGRTLAEMGEDKHLVSHRALAFSGLWQYLSLAQVASD